MKKLKRQPNVTHLDYALSNHFVFSLFAIICAGVIGFYEPYERFINNDFPLLNAIHPIIKIIHLFVLMIAPIIAILYLRLFFKVEYIKNSRDELLRIIGNKVNCQLLLQEIFFNGVYTKEVITEDEIDERLNKWFDSRERGSWFYEFAVESRNMQKFMLDLGHEDFKFTIINMAEDKGVIETELVDEKFVCNFK